MSGAFSFTVMLSNNEASTPAALACSSFINAPPIPPLSVGITSTPTLFQPVFAGLQLAAPAPLPLTGVAQLTFTPNAFGITDNPQVYFDGRDATPQGRLVPFTIPAGQTTIPLPNIQQGTVAGTIRVEVIQLRDGTRDVLPAAHPFGQLIIPQQAPLITDVTSANETVNGFEVVISGISTPRDVKSVTLTFNAAQGATVEGTGSFTVDVSSLFTQFYSTQQSQLVGSMFTNLRVPITISGDKAAIGSVSVVITNSVGNSQTVTKTR
jgi:hypothetical protein